MTAAPAVLVCGAGSIGRRHIANLRALGAAVSVWRARTALAAGLEAELGLVVYTDLEAAIEAAEAVVVATAPDRHLAVAQRAADRGKALFLEKPLSHTMAGVERLVEAAAGLVVEVGCQTRAHPNLGALAARLAAGGDGPILAFRAVLGQRLDQWRPGTDYRASYSADAARGGGALFDLVHEIDLVHWLVGRPLAVTAELAKVSDLEIAGDDLANLILVTEGGAVGQVQLDMLSPAYRRELEIVCRDAVYHWSHADGTLVRRAGSAVEIVDRLPPRFERNDLFREHMRHFLARLADPALPPLCSLADGVAVLGTALAARRAAETGARVRLVP